jgi:anti-sigma factor RsiW
MTKLACPRAFEAEALRDGRLVGAERLSYERHVHSCAHCSREVAALDALRDLLCNSGSETDADELHVRRERTRLLAAFDAKLAPPERRSPARGWLVGTAAASLLVLTLFGYFGARSVAPGDTRGAIVVHADGAASWSRRSDGAVETLLLEQGALSILVDHALDHRRLLVVLPDGELEDIGTRFTVSADAGRTTRVRVESGSVVLRIRGQAPRSLSAGDTWDPSQLTSAAPCASCEPVRVPGSASTAPTLPSTAPTLPSTPSTLPSTAPTLPSTPPAPPSGHAQRAPTAAASSAPTASPAASAAAANPSLDFRAAMAALDGGENGTAAARFARFLSTHPLDARCEDAAYLRVIALQRTGDADAMKEAAAHYLRDYPKGFRRAEVAALVH